MAMTVSAIRKKLNHFIENASDEKIKAMYSMVEDDLKTDKYSNYSKEFKLELDRRLAAYSNGLSLPVSSQDSKKRIRQILEAGKQ